jgi:hypothetical protein
MINIYIKNRLLIILFYQNKKKIEKKRLVK